MAVFVTNDHYIFRTCKLIEYILIAFSFVIIFLFLNSKYANSKAIPMNVSVRFEDFQRAR